MSETLDVKAGLQIFQAMDQHERLRAEPDAALHAQADVLAALAWTGPTVPLLGGGVVRIE
jgi:hypothetical protein